MQQIRLPTSVAQKVFLSSFSDVVLSSKLPPMLLLVFGSYQLYKTFCNFLIETSEQFRGYCVRPSRCLTLDEGYRALVDELKSTDEHELPCH